MWKCIKCGMQNTDVVKHCQCGFDQTMNYTIYNTLTRIPSDVISEFVHLVDVSSEFVNMDSCYQRLKEILKTCSEENRKKVVSDLCMYFQDLQSNIHYQNISMVKECNDTYKIGDIIKFGKYRYRILDVKEDKLFIICTELVNHYQFPEMFFERPIVWKDSILRTWLNKDFYETFTTKEQERICEVSIHTNDDTFTVVKEWNGKSYTKTVSGGPDTKDKIFLLSDEEVIKYLDSINDRIIKGEWWYLRTPARDVYVGSVDFNGVIDLDGEKCKAMYGGIRPAMWILSKK